MPSWVMWRILLPPGFCQSSLTKPKAHHSCKQCLCFWVPDLRQSHNKLHPLINHQHVKRTDFYSGKQQEESVSDDWAYRCAEPIHPSHTGRLAIVFEQSQAFASYSHLWCMRGKEGGVSC